MGFEGGLRAHLEADASVGALAGSLWSGRIPEGAAHPAVLIRRISTVRELAQDGPAGWADVRTQVDVYADGYAEAHNLATAIRRAVGGYSGGLGGADVRGLMVAAERDLFEEHAAGEGRHRVSMDITGMVRET